MNWKGLVRCRELLKFQTRNLPGGLRNPIKIIRECSRCASRRCEPVRSECETETYCYTNLIGSKAIEFYQSNFLCVDDTDICSWINDMTEAVSKLVYSSEIK